MTRRCWIGALAASGAAWSSELELWDSAAGPVPKVAELSGAEGVRLSTIKPHEPDRDGGYGFLHGVALAWHKGKLYSSFGHNKNIENTTGEQARGRISRDGGKTWGEIFTIDAGSPDLAVSHGSFLSHRGRLWAFLGAFHGKRERVHTRAYVLDERRGTWEPRGTVAGGGFWPMQQPLRMSDGNWIMAGFNVGNGEPASVAISHGDDFTKWDHVTIPRDPSVKTMWGESTVIVQGRSVLNIARYGAEALALISQSNDGGRSWSPMRASNLPMATSKPYAGVLSTGQQYLICTTSADSGKRRSPLTIAVSKPHAAAFSKVFRIRTAERGNLAYPYAVEHRGYLYAGYSDNGGRAGMNINSAELAVIPVASLRA